MLYKNKKHILNLVAILCVTFYFYSCTQEKSETKTLLIKKTTYDFLGSLSIAEINTAKENYVKVVRRQFTVNEEDREVLFEHPNSEVEFKDILVEENSELKFGIAINPEVWNKTGDGVLFEIKIIDAKSQSKSIFSKYIDPKNNIEDRKWFDERIDLSTFARQKVSFVFKTTGGPKNDISTDWAAWSSPAIISKVKIDDYPISLEKTSQDLIVNFAKAEIVTKSKAIQKSKIVVKPNDIFLVSEREAILAYPPSEFRYEVTIPDNGFLQFGVGVAASSPGKNVSFEIYVNSNKIFSRYLTEIKENKRWFDEKINLSKYRGKRVNLRFKTLHRTQAHDSTSSVMAGWSKIRLSEVAPVSRNLSSTDQPNVILIVLDTQRADHLTCYGYNRDTSPTLKKFAEEGILFENAISQSSWTWPATATILTGLYPYTHGVINNNKSFLVNDIVTLAELLQKNHFTTFGVSANPLINKSKNFDQGFETFKELPEKAEVLNQRFLSWLEINNDLQFFAYLHYMDPHEPYSAPGRYHTMFDQKYKGKFPFKEDPWYWKDQQFTERDVEHLVARYDGETRYWDSQFKDLLENLRRLNVLEKTIIILTSDHGEAFLEHGRFGHSQHLYDELTRVPFIIWLPERTESKRIVEQVETVDIYPTLCTILGIEIPKNIQGKSLFPWTEVKSHSPYAFSQTEAVIPGKGISMRISVRTNEWKLIYTPSSKKYELFELSVDREEKNNSFGLHSIDKFQSKLEEWLLATRKNMPDNRQEIDADTMQKLRSLGYIK